MKGEFWVEVVGDIVLARLRGNPTEELIRDVQKKIIRIVKDSEQAKILYDALEVETPTVEVTLSQMKLSEDLKHTRRAIVVPNTKLAYLSRIAFGEGDYKVFYNDLGAALSWLKE